MLSFFHVGRAVHFHTADDSHVQAIPDDKIAVHTGKSSLFPVVSVRRPEKACEGDMGLDLELFRPSESLQVELELVIKDFFRRAVPTAV